MTIHEAELKEKRRFLILSWLYVKLIVGEMILMMHAFRLLPSCVENEFGGSVVSLSSAAERHSGSRGLDQRTVTTQITSGKGWQLLIGRITKKIKCSSHKRTSITT